METRQVPNLEIAGSIPAPGSPFMRRRVRYPGKIFDIARSIPHGHWIGHRGVGRWLSEPTTLAPAPQFFEIAGSAT